MGLSKTREKLSSQLGNLFHTGKIDENFYEELQMILLSADVGISASEFLIEKVRQLVKEDNISDPKKLKDLLKLQVGDEISFQKINYLKKGITINKWYKKQLKPYGKKKYRYS